MKLKRGLALAQLAVALAAFGSAANAAGPANGPCAEDIKKFCADVKPGDGGIANCLKQHEADLSAACRAHEKQVRAKFDEFDAACGADARKLCADVKSGKARVMKCLHGKDEQLSPDCKNYMEKVNANMRRGHGPGPMGK